MTEAHLDALLAVAEAAADDEGWRHPSQGRTMTLHLAHDGAGLSISRVAALRLEHGLLQVRTAQGEWYVVALADLYAGSVEAPKEGGRKAGFV